MLKIQFSLYMWLLQSIKDYYNTNLYFILGTIKGKTSTSNLGKDTTLK